MKTRYTKRVREEAALMASVAACDRHRTRAADFIRDEISAEAVGLYFCAWTEASRRLTSEPVISEVLDAEAEALIRTGWSPE